MQFGPIGATVARQIPVLKVTCSNHVSVTQKVAGAAARSFPKFTRPPNAGGGAAMSKESVAEAKKRADALVPRPRP